MNKFLCYEFCPGSTLYDLIKFWPTTTKEVIYNLLDYYTPVFWFWRTNLKGVHYYYLF